MLQESTAPTCHPLRVVGLFLFLFSFSQHSVSIDCVPDAMQGGFGIQNEEDATLPNYLQYTVRT